jgi:hypothetical protein
VININESILVKGFAVCMMFLCIILAGNAFCESELYDMQNLEDVVKDDGDSNTRELIEKGVIPPTTDAANIWDANFTAERKTPERAETTKRIHHRNSNVSNHGVVNPTGVANPGGAVSSSQPGSVNAPQSTK